MTRWFFMNGSVVDAKTYDSAVDKLKRCNFTTHWAMEEEPGKWCVLFDRDVEVHVKAETSFEAAKKAIYAVTHSEGDILTNIKPSYSKRQSSGEQTRRRCCWGSMFEQD